ncbi:hypothetical protein ABPG75_003814 [Micractinium tetrahymenae]
MAAMAQFVPLTTSPDAGRPPSEMQAALGPVYSPASPLPADIRLPTLYESWQGCVAQYGPEPCLGRRVGATYNYLTYEVRWGVRPGRRGQQGGRSRRGGAGRARVRSAGWVVAAPLF